MLIGIGTYTYTWAIGVPGSNPERPMSVYGLLDKAKDLQVPCVQIADNLPLNGFGNEELVKIRKYARELGLIIEIGGRGLTEENLDKYIDLAEFFDSKILRMVIDQGDFKPTPDQVVSIIRNALNRLVSADIILALENHERLTASIFRSIVEKISSESTGICLDCVNSMGIGEGIDTVTACLVPYTVNLHVKDFVVRRLSHMMGYIVEGAPAGKGFLDLAVLIDKLKSYGKCRSAVLELWTPPAGNLEETIQKEENWAQESILYMKKIITES